MISEEEILNSRAKYKAAFSTEDGFAVLEDLKRRFHVHGTTFSTDPHEIAYNEGQRTVILFILAQMEDLPKEISQQLKQLSEETFDE
tara:strand:- start:147 stop:407 length:261 start_codon:yes stop_codon:yes gene_type:complete